MNPLVSIIMGSTSDMGVMKQAAEFLNEMEIPFEINALSAHRVPQQVMEFAGNAASRGVKVIIAGAGGAAHLPGVIAAITPLPVIGVPVNSSNSIDGWDSILSILQMPAGIPVATVALDGAKNAAILALQILATGDPAKMEQMVKFKRDLAKKIVKANEELDAITYNFKVPRTK
ncbi:MAG: 5-(carboxyamino)imidazole ribonucleotide mutase [Bacteroidales bacterium]|jgi:5-(carboxyamino)imidazole ribonucleotide mutase|nr:5-(carboxyamino)imidazole ribonucleotide mutase [Bacteroidales bacterium]MDD3273390.1 5-(carboxyamino)imidazole ribonucleotide mutase [Bacteroidales bacterium]